MTRQGSQRHQAGTGGVVTSCCHERQRAGAVGVGTSSLPRATKDKFGTKKSPEPNQDPGNLI